LKSWIEKTKVRRLYDSQDFNNLNKLAKEMDSLEAKMEPAERKRIGFPIPGTENVSKETAKEKGKEKAEEVKKQETPAGTSNKVNTSVKNKK